MEEGNKLDRILEKYITIWVWSILVGVITSMTFSFIGFDVRSRGPFALVVIGPIYMAGVSASLATWYFALKYLRFFIVPIFFWGEQADLVKDPRAWGSINRMAFWMFIAVTFRLFLALSDFAFNAAVF